MIMKSFKMIFVFLVLGALLPSTGHGCDNISWRKSPDVGSTIGHQRVYPGTGCYP